MKKVLRFQIVASVVLVMCMATAITASAQTFKTLADFNGTNGSHPMYPTLVQGANGDLYGMTIEGGATGQGTVFRLSPSGALTAIYSFCTQSGCPDGSYPYGGLVQATDGNLYGVTSAYGRTSDGGSGWGTVFKITPGGTLTTLHVFDLTDGGIPYAALVQGADGNFYGTTLEGGANSRGTIFKITPTGTLTTLHSFDGADGLTPLNAMVQAIDGNFYGTTLYGGPGSCNKGCGTIFKISPGGTLTTLHSFDAADGASPAMLLQAANGDFYGTTYYGGADSSCSGGCGTVFKITPGGTLTTLHSFSMTDGAYPLAGLNQATDGDFYGTTSLGGGSNACTGGCGTIFKITPGGKLTTLHSFDLADGLGPTGLAQATNGSFYGAANGGGTFGAGTVYNLAVGLDAFVETVPTSGKVGSKITILGNGLTGTTGVTFNGTAATFTIVSTTEIKTTVPTGATSGKVQVTTPHGTLTSNVVFRVK